MIFVCLLLVVESLTRAESSSNTRFSLSEQIVVGRPFNDEVHQDNNNNTIIIVDEDHKQGDVDNKLAKSTAGRFSSYPPIGDRSLADLLARNSFTIINKNKNNNSINDSRNGDDIEVDVDIKPLIESLDSIDKPTIEDVQCDNGNTFQATIVLPKTFVIEPEFNDLSHDDSSDILNSYCTINQVKYRLYPTYRISVRDYRLCGITSSREQHHRQSRGRRRRRRRRPAASNELKSESSRRNEKSSLSSSSSSSNDNNLLARRRHERVVSSANKDDYDNHHQQHFNEQVYMLNIRFPVIKSLRTEEDTYATLVCSPPERVVESTRREDSDGHGDDVSDHDDSDDDSNEEEEELAGDDSVAGINGGITNNNLRDNEAVMGDESRRQLHFVASKSSPNNATGRMREPLLIQDTFNVTTSIVWPMTLSKQPEDVDIDYKSSLRRRPPPSSLDAARNSTTDTGLVSVSTATVAVPFAIDKTNSEAATTRPSSLSGGASGRILELRQPEQRQHHQPPTANSSIKPTRATVNSSTNNTSSLRYNDYNSNHDHDQLQTMAVSLTGRESGRDRAGGSLTYETKRGKQWIGDKAVVVRLSGNKLPSGLSSESHELLSLQASSNKSTPPTTIRKHVTSTAKTAAVMQTSFNETFPPTNKTTEQQMMQTNREPPDNNSNNNIRENNGNITKNTIRVATLSKNSNDDEYVDIDDKSALLTTMKQSKTLKGTETHQLNLSLMAFVLSILIIFLVFAIIIELNISSCR